MALPRFLQVFNGDYPWLCYRQRNLPHVYPQRAVFVLLCASLTFSSVALAQQGVFVPTGSLNTARSGPTSTLLKNGMVLIVGGASAPDPSVELYNPATYTFSFTGSMNVARSGFTATLLNNGKVLVAAGADSTGVLLASAELYDPATGTFTPTGGMSTPRTGHTATLMNDGTVLVAGGFKGVPNCSVACGGGAAASAELYDPATGTFGPTGSLNIARFDHRATLLNNGMVLVVAGDGGCPHVCPLDSAELYNPATGTFNLTGSLSIPIENHTATLLNDGTVLVAGGYNAGFGVTGGAELYDPATGTFTSTVGGGMTRPREFHTATLLNNGTVLVAGGDYQSGPLALADLYDPTTKTFSATGSMNTPRTGHTAALLNNGTVLVAGGSALANTELYEPVAVIPPSVSFANQPVGTTSASQTVTVTNNESTALTITSISIDGANTSAFAETDNCVGKLSAGASCSINLTFTPAGTGTFVAGLAIANSLSPSSMPVPLSGAGVAVTRVASVSPSSLTFGAVVVGMTGAESVTISNTGNSVLTVSTVAITGTNSSDFAESNNCVGSVAAGASCDINLTLTPTATGTRTATLSITDDATSPQSPQAVPLTATGQDFSMTSPAPTATVTAGQTVTYSVSVSPEGGFNQTVSFSCGGAPSLSTCNAAPSVVTLNGTSATSVTIVVSTTAPAMVLPNYPRTGPLYPDKCRAVAIVLVLSVLALMASLFKQGRHRRHSLATVSLLALTICIGLALAACGGGGSSNLGTPKGTYTLTVTGTVTSGSTTAAHSTKLTVVVQ